ncbi:response regulator transcription factor [bacterium]|nr:response regulator transcription factor [bacterium]MBU1883987.1 response regulator transcription factor [bacterium]
MNKNRILLLEDDTNLGETLLELLQENGYEVDLAIDGEEAIELSYKKSYHLYIFDINVPKIDGLELLDALREADDKTPTVFISAMVDLKTMARGFALGADDYIKKPFFPEELLLRIDAKMQRISSKIICGKISYNPSTKEVLKDGVHLALSHMLLLMFDLLILSKGKVVDKDELYTCMENPSSTALRVALTKLKQQTGIEIKNIRGVGYSIESC